MNQLTGGGGYMFYDIFHSLPKLSSFVSDLNACRTKCLIIVKDIFILLFNVNAYIFH